MRKITFSYEGRDYSLAYSRESVRTMERQGFSIDTIGETPVTTIPELFYGAFAVYHRGIKRKLVDEIWESLGNKNDLIVALVELYGETVEDLLSDETDESKKVSWEVN